MAAISGFGGGVMLGGFMRDAGIARSGSQGCDHVMPHPGVWQCPIPQNCMIIQVPPDPDGDGNPGDFAQRP
jgi:hypothetical protein